MSSLEIDSFGIRLRAAGCIRVGASLFLLVWLAGWGLGGYSLLAPMLPALQGLDLPILIDDPPVTAVPAIIIAPFWLAGLVAAIVTMLRLLWGVDTFEFGSGELVVRRSIGPLHRTRRLARSEIAAIGLHARERALVAWLTSGREIVLSSMGTPRDRQQAADAIRRRLMVAAPSASLADLGRDWKIEHTAGGLRIQPSAASRRGCVGCGGAVTTVLLALAVTQLLWGNRADALILGGVASFVLLLTLAFARARDTIEAHKGLIQRSTGVALWNRTESIEPLQLEVKLSRDGDGDETAHLVARAAGGREMTLHSSSNDPWKLVALGEQLSKATGARLVLPAELRNS